jgi:hypothetical protein
MSPLARPHPTTEGRRGFRIDLEEGGAIWVSPEIAQSERSRVSKEPGAVQGYSLDVEVLNEFSKPRVRLHWFNQQNMVGVYDRLGWFVQLFPALYKIRCDLSRLGIDLILNVEHIYKPGIR